MRQITEVREIQLLELRLLDAFAAFMKENGLKFMLCGGTMLGAVRHQGFIPWDDDVDVLVPRADYERLKAIARPLGDSIEFRMPGDENYPYPFLKLVDTRTRVADSVIDTKFDSQIWIDIFPLDHFPDDHRAHKLYILRNFLFRGFLSSHTHRKGKRRGNLLVRTCMRIGYPLLGGYKNLTKRIDRMALKLDRKYASSKHYGNGAWPERMKDYFKEQMVTPLTELSFEGRSFPAPEHYDAYLSHFYGDYMTLPPVEKRGKHTFEAWIEE